MIPSMHPEFCEHSFDGVVYLECTPIRQAGFRHGFSTRRGGESVEPYDSLDLQRPGAAPDRRDELERNTARFLTAVGLPASGLADAQQVHGRLVLDACSAGLRGAGDALVAEPGGPVVGVRAADCVPVLLADPGNGRVAAVHAGWRGIVAGVLGAAVDALKERGSDPARLIAAIGPAIGAQHFEVGTEVVAAFLAVELGDCILPTEGGKALADLALAARTQLRVAGLQPINIHACDCCTAADAGRFFSHRRDAGWTGRMLAVIAPRFAKSTS